MTLSNASIECSAYTMQSCDVDALSRDLAMCFVNGSDVEVMNETLECETTLLVNEKNCNSRRSLEKSGSTTSDIILNLKLYKREEYENMLKKKSVSREKKYNLCCLEIFISFMSIRCFHFHNLNN